MPALPPTEKPVDAADLRPVRRYELGLVAFGETILAVIELEPSKGPTVQYAMSLASAVTFCADLTAMIESDAGIEALVKATLADARVIKARGMRADAAARCGKGPDECEDCADAAADRELPPPPAGAQQERAIEIGRRAPGLPVPLGVMGDGGILWCCSRPDGCALCQVDVES